MDFTYTLKEWEAKGERLFGKNRLDWKFICPRCKNVQDSNDFRVHMDKGATPSDSYRRCIGRYTGGLKGSNKCDWASFGLFRGPSIVITEDGTEIFVFNFNE